ncbi:MAG: sigma-70 family RNA polymerase sigma factor [Phycisphaeraceae bacterium]|nr:sigma-70 family RNA polymerase sigma factor [Phycisphaeraceae bacterium]
MPIPAHPEDLLAAARKGDRAALVSLLEQVGPTVRHRIEPKIGKSIRSSIDADDVMQVTYLEAVLKLGSFTSGGIEGFIAWLTRLAENNLVDAVRALEAAKRPDPKKRIRPGPGQDTHGVLIDALGMTYTTPSVVAKRHEANGFLEDALGRLPPAYAKVIRLYDLAGKPIEEVAAEMDKSQGAVYMLRARAHERLKETLGSESRFFSVGG